MCVVSMAGDWYKDKWSQPDSPFNPIISQPITQPYMVHISNITREEFDSLKKEILEMKDLLTRALEYDRRNNEPHCEMEDKVALLKKVAEVFGVDLSEIFGSDK